MATTDRQDWREDDAERAEAARIKTTRSAVDVLQHDQRRLLFDGDQSRTPPLTPWVEGFDSAREVVNWWQAAAVRTVGGVAEHLPPERLYRDQALAEHLLDARSDSEQFRRRILRQWLRPVCDHARRVISTSAEERLNDKDDLQAWSDIDPREEKHVAMRPGFSRLETNQAAVLRWLWGGFESADELDRWLHRLPAATNNHHDSRIAAKLTEPPHEGHYFLDSSREARRRRVQFAIVKLLPAFAKAAASYDAGETHQDRGGPSGAGKIA